MKQFDNNRIIKAVYNNFNNRKNKIFSGLSYEFDYEFADEFDKEKNADYELNKRQHKRESINKKSDNSNTSK